MAAIAVGVEVTSVSYGARHQSLWPSWYELFKYTYFFWFSQWFLCPKINDFNIKIPKEFFPFGNKISKIYSKPRKLHTLVASLIASVFSFCKTMFYLLQDGRKYQICQTQIFKMKSCWTHNWQFFWMCIANISDKFKLWTFLWFVCKSGKDAGVRCCIIIQALCREFNFRAFQWFLW